MPMLIVAVFLAGGLGALTRSVLGAAVTRRWQATFPLGTSVVNISGAFLLGVVTGWGIEHAGPDAQDLVAILGIGFCGAYTTFSSEEWHAYVRKRSDTTKAAPIIIMDLLFSMAVAAVGLWLGRLI